MGPSKIGRFWVEIPGEYIARSAGLREVEDDNR